MDQARDIDLRPLLTADAGLAAALIRAAFAAQSVATQPPASALRESAESVAASFAAAGQEGARQGRAVSPCGRTASWSAA